MVRDKPSDPPTTQVMLGAKACTMGIYKYNYYSHRYDGSFLIPLYGRHKEEIYMSFIYYAVRIPQNRTPYCNKRRALLITWLREEGFSGDYECLQSHSYAWLNLYTKVITRPHPRADKRCSPRKTITINQLINNYQLFRREAIFAQHGFKDTLHVQKTGCKVICSNRPVEKK